MIGWLLIALLFAGLFALFVYGISSDGTSKAKAFGIVTSIFATCAGLMGFIHLACFLIANGI